MKELLTGFVVDAQEFHLALAFIPSGQSFFVFTQIIIKKKGEGLKRREKSQFYLKISKVIGIIIIVL